jgi:hypothetical protein
MHNTGGANMPIYGNMIGGAAPIKTMIIRDEDGNEVVGVVTDSVHILTATNADIVAGKVAVTEDGIVTGTHSCE